MIQRILDKATAGERLSPEEGLALLDSNDLAAIGRAADAVTRRLHPEPYPHVQHRPQHQLHQRLHRGLRLLRVLPQAEATPKATCCRARCCYRRSRRRSTWAATRS